MKFTKMNGLGNDYILIDAVTERVDDPVNAAIRLSDRRFGIGGDGIVLIGDSAIADLSMRIFNADGTEAEICGNALRCIGKYAYEHGLSLRPHMTVETKAGVKDVSVTLNGKVVSHASVNFGAGEKGFDNYPFSYAAEAFGRTYSGFCVNMGNPHFVLFVDSFPEELPKIGESIGRRNGVFRNGANVEFAIKRREREYLVRVVERGSGETSACGSGAAAVCFAATERDGLYGEINVLLPGGTLRCKRTSNGEISVFGEVKENFTGSVKWE